MKFKKIILSALCLFTIQNYALAEDNKVLYQVSTLNALLNGVYEGTYTLKNLKKHGSLGLGTFNDLYGEMVYLDGVFYQVRTDGKVYKMDGDVKTPYALVTDFKPDKEVEIDQEMDYEELKKYIDSLIPSENIFYAFKIEGKFKSLKTRSVPKQSKPFPPLTDVVKHQAIFELKDVEGTMLGFKEPAYTKGVNVGSYHLHFLTKDRKKGGHVLGVITDKVKMKIDELTIFTLVLPASKGFYTSKINKSDDASIRSVEH